MVTSFSKAPQPWPATGSTKGGSPPPGRRRCDRGRHGGLDGGRGRNGAEAVAAAAAVVAALGTEGGRRVPEEVAKWKVIMVLMVGGLGHFLIIFPHIGKKKTQLTFIFFRGVETTNQWLYNYSLYGFIVVYTRTYKWKFHPMCVL